jgi:hypothetical protein
LNRDGGKNEIENDFGGGGEAVSGERGGRLVSGNEKLK